VLGTLAVLGIHTSIHSANGKIQRSPPPHTEDLLGLAGKIDTSGKHRTLLPGAHGVSHCLANLSKRWHTEELVSLVSDHAGKSTLGKEVFHRYLEPGLKSVNVWSKKRLSNRSAAFMDIDLSKPGYVDDILELTWANFDELSNWNGLEAFYCISRHSILPTHKDMEPFLRSTIEQVVSQVRTQWDDLLHGPDGFLAQIKQPISKAFEEFLSGAKLLEEAGNWAYQQCAKDVSASKEQIKKVAKATDKEKREQIQKLTVMLQETGNDVVATVGAAAVGAQLSKLFAQLYNDIIGPMLARAAASVQSVGGTGLHVVDGLAGLVPEVGAAISALLTSAIEITLSSLQASLIHGAEKTIQDSFHQIKIQVSAWVQSSAKGALPGAGAKAAENALHGDATHFRFVIHPILKLIKLLLPEVTKQMANCNELKSNLKDMVESF